MTDEGRVRSSDSMTDDSTITRPSVYEAAGPGPQDSYGRTVCINSWVSVPLLPAPRPMYVLTGRPG